ncbi:hypothetical protein AWENTII_010648 [Aspergillus wentii]
METDTIIIGNGPSAMILSYILHGHLPYYSPNPPHPDPLLHGKLKDSPELLDADVNALTDHFAASRLSYSTQALPVNVLLDTLVRPSVDVDETESTTNVEWRYAPEKAVPHLVFGNAPQPGGQWTDNPMPSSWDIQTLSYATMLSLPGYPYAEHYRKVTGKDLPAYTRPSRLEIADYFRAYPEAVKIDDAFRSHETLANISRTERGFYIQSHNIYCKHLVLASGIFSEVLRPLPMLSPLLSLQPTPDVPFLVIGSGFSAADVMISAPKDQKILHVFKWDPEGRPSPLRGCHQQAYPEYAGVYRLMKRAASATQPTTTKRSKNRRVTSTPFLESRNWGEVYEGLPNIEIIHVEPQGDMATVTFRQPDGTILSHQVRGLVYATGRRGTLGYLDNPLLSEVLGYDVGTEIDPAISSQTLRGKAFENMEVARDVFIIGSLTGDSLIRFSHGGCIQTAGRLIRAYAGEDETGSTCSSSFTASRSIGPSLPVMNGIDGHDVYANGNKHRRLETSDVPSTSRTENLGLVEWLRSLVRMWQ